MKQKQFRELNEAEIMRHLILMGSTFIFSTVENMAAIWRRFMAITFKFSLEAVAEGCLRTASPPGRRGKLTSVKHSHFD